MTETQGNPNLQDAEREKCYRHEEGLWSRIGFSGFAIFIGMCAIAGGYAAWTNDRGLIINGIIKMGPTTATIFYACSFVFGGVLFVLCAVTAFGRLVKPASVVLGPDEIVFCNGWLFPKRELVAFKSIQAINERLGNKVGTRYLILTVGSRKFLICERLLSGPQAYDEIHAAIIAGRKNSQAS